MFSKFLLIDFATFFRYWTDGWNIFYFLITDITFENSIIEALRVIKSFRVFSIVHQLIRFLTIHNTFFLALPMDISHYNSIVHHLIHMYCSWINNFFISHARFIWISAKNDLHLIWQLPLKIDLKQSMQQHFLVFLLQLQFIS